MIQAVKKFKKLQVPAWLEELRCAAQACFDELGFPTVRQEEWRYTNVAPIAKTSFADAPTPPPLARKDIPFHDWHEPQIVFINGTFVPGLSTLKELPAGVFVGSLAEVLVKDPAKLQPFLASPGVSEQHAFGAWNTANLRDGAFVHVPRGIAVTQPIHLIFVSTLSAKPFVSHVRNVIVLEEGAQARLVESYAGTDKSVYLTNAVTQIFAGKNAVLDHYKLQQENENAYHVAVTEIRQGRSSNVASQSLSLGAALVRNDIRVLLEDEGAELRLDGLYMVSGKQHVDHHTVIDHCKPHCNSTELYLGILDGHAHGVFDGKIFVRQDAQKSNARQTNKNLLLSDTALANTKPQLEIYADDVKCNHGATIGQLDEDALFYLRSRGIAPDAARGMLTFAFANQILDRIHVTGLRAWLQGYVWNKLPGGHAPEAKP